ncbi:MAG TPA: phosphoglucosamine mutase [Acidimicrobiales bacterium]|nr:phosphoglucosamine mutase [Acidimicrobiales bacterium]
MTLRFGTDGIRGSDHELTPELVVALGRAAAAALGLGPGARFVIGRDTRRSGPLLESALAAGLAAAGVHVERLGVLPTPGVAWVSATQHVAGAMISASHNVYSDNGIKFFAPGGRKLSDAVEATLEAALDELVGQQATGRSALVDVPGTVVDVDRSSHYGERVLASLEGRRLDGLSIALDPAHGAASVVGPDVLVRSGAALTVLHAAPDGTNINDDCGSTSPEALCGAVVESGADLGLALDGDADRVVAVDHRGELVDGDQLLVVLALDMQGRGLLRDDTIVVTVMANLGLHRAMADHGIAVVQTPVGDRHVMAALERGGWSLGGEQSGHIILPALATTGDGLLTGLLVADVVRRTGRSLAELASAMTRLPQVLRAVRLARRDPELAARWRDEVVAVEEELAGEGRVLVRASGTEPVVRVMVEAPEAEWAERLAERLVKAIEQATSFAGGQRPPASPYVASASSER